MTVLITVSEKKDMPITVNLAMTSYVRLYSAMTMLIVNAIEVSYASKVEYDIDDEKAIISVKAYGALPEFEEDPMKRFAVSGLIQAYYYQLNDMLDEYYDFIDVVEINE